MSEIYKKMIDEAMAAQRADIDTIYEKRYTDFKVVDAKPYADAVAGMTALPTQAESVINLHKDSVKTHFKVLSSLCDTIRPEDDPMVEHYQTPPVLEILCEEDADFAESVSKFADAIADNEALVAKESIRRYGGFYGPTCVVDFAMMPGSTSNVVNRILKTVDIPTAHKQAILSAKSWGMLTSYGIGSAFAAAIEAGKTAAEASEDEVKALQMLYTDPIEAQGSAGVESFDVRKYMQEYKKDMTPTVKAAMDDEVHYGNIVTVPAYCVGDIGHHIAQSTYNMCKDDVTMEIIRATSDVIENTLRNNLDKFNSPMDVLSLATGSSACATEFILELDGFNAPMIADLLTKRYHNYVQQYPSRGAADELHNCDVDLSPITTSEVLMNPQRYTYPSCGITVRFSSLMRLADFPCLLTSEPITATMMTNVIALNPKVPGSPVRGCKNCAFCSIDVKHEYCQWKEAV